MIHVTALESMAAQLNDLGVGITDHAVMTKILCSLPSRFDHLVSSWDSMGENDKRIEALRGRLVTEERKINLRAAQTAIPTEGYNQPSTSGGSGPNAAFFGQGNSSTNTNAPRHSGNFGRGRRGGGSHSHSRSREQIARDSAQCTYCGKRRHYAFECRI